MHVVWTAVHAVLAGKTRRSLLDQIEPNQPKINGFFKARKTSDGIERSESLEKLLNIEQQETVVNASPGTHAQSNTVPNPTLSTNNAIAVPSTSISKSRDEQVQSPSAIKRLAKSVPALTVSKNNAKSVPQSGVSVQLHGISRNDVRHVHLHEISKTDKPSQPHNIPRKGGQPIQPHSIPRKDGQHVQLHDFPRNGVQPAQPHDIPRNGVQPAQPHDNPRNAALKLSMEHMLAEAMTAEVRATKLIEHVSRSAEKFETKTPVTSPSSKASTEPKKPPVMFTP